MNAQRLARTALIALFVATGLAGCGKLGELERPGPLSPTAKAAGEPARTVTVDPRDHATDPAPPRAAPIPGLSGSSNAAAPPPPSASPDVYSNPR